jgi:Ca2+-binding RTX toxin-like protein
MTTIHDTYINALLADATYVDDLQRGMTGVALRDKLAGRMTPEQAAYIGDNFSVVTQVSGLNSSFEATIWKDKSGQVYVSMRGTQEVPDFAADGDLATSGLAHQQLADMVNWWLRATTPPMTDADTPKYATQITVDPYGNFALAPSVLGTGELTGITAIKSVNGHSLGGYLASSFVRLFGSQWPVQTINTFNSAGFSRVSATNIESGFNQIAQLIGTNLGPGNFLTPQNNYFALNGINVTTNTWDPVGFQQYGTRIGLFQEDLTPDGINNHYMYKLTDLLALGDAMEQLDPGMNLTKLSTLVSTASNQMKASYETLLDAIRKTVLGGGMSATLIGDANAGNAGPQPTARLNYQTNLDYLKNNSNFAALVGQVQIVSLADRNSSDLATDAKSEFGTFVALKLGLPVMLRDTTGSQASQLYQTNFSSDYAAWRALGSGDLSTQWIADRAKFLHAVLTANSQDFDYRTNVNALFVDGEGSNPVDFIVHDPSGNYVLHTLPAGVASQDRGDKYLIEFGSDGNDQFDSALIGGGGNDKLYGGGGADDLDGGQGDDYIEGDSGNDNLTGGTDRDTLVGGTGFDGYFFTKGSNNDTVIDSDGSGAIFIDSTIVNGGKKVSTNYWLSTDKKFAFTLAANATGGNDLIVGRTDTGDTVNVSNWSSGQLGITLQGGNDDTPDDKVKDDFDASKKWVRRRDPLVLDLDGDGVETVPISTTSPIMFDGDADGIKTSTGWVKADDGFLVMDRNGNGVIDNGSEQFGNSTPLSAGGTAADGFAALAQEDTNLDGKVDSADSRWGQLRVWRDLNQDGISQSNELFTMTQIGVASFNVAKTQNLTTLSNGNQIADLGFYTKTDGSTGTMGDVTQLADVNLAQDTFHSQFTDSIPLKSGITSLPEMKGSGKVRDLWQAASITSTAGSTLQQKLTAYAAATTRAQQQSLLDDLVAAWGATSTMTTSVGVNLTKAHVGGSPTTTGKGKNAKTIYDYDSTDTAIQRWATNNPDLYKKDTALEQFNGQTILTGWVVQTASYANGGKDYAVVYSTDQGTLLNNSYNELRDSVYYDLLPQTRFKSLFDEIGVAAGNNGIVLDFSAVKRTLQDKIAADSTNGMIDLIDFTQTVDRKFQNSGWNGWDMVANYMSTITMTPDLLSFLNTTYTMRAGSSGNDTIGGTNANVNRIFGLAGDDSLAGGIFADTLDGGAGNDTLSGNLGNDLLLGGDGNDILYGDPGNDALVGGKGNDTLYGGSSPYSDTITNGNDIYRFAKGDGVDTIIDYDTNANLDTIEFTDVASTEVTLLNTGNDLVIRYGNGDQVTVVNQFNRQWSSGIEQVKFSDGVVWGIAEIRANVVMMGTAGNDTLNGAVDFANKTYGLDGDDVITGSGFYGDTLDGGAGNDTIDGSYGNDLLIGGEGNDSLNGNYDNDTLIGGHGNDTLNGGSSDYTGASGSDTYRFSKGDGVDTIIDYDTKWNGTDTIEFTDVASTEVVLLNTGNDLVVQYGSGDKITVFNNYNRGSSYGIEQMKFSDGVIWDFAAINAHVVMNGTGGNDTLNGAVDFANRIYGFDGDDSIRGSYFYGDLLVGGAGNDTLSGDGAANDGTDTLIGGTGNDVLYGKTGVDYWTDSDSGYNLYVFSVGDGVDQIFDYNRSTSSADVIQFTNVASTELRGMERKGDDLIINYGVSDQITVKKYFDLSNMYAIEQMKFSDGVTWDAATIRDKAAYMYGTSGDDTVSASGFYGNYHMYGYDGSDSISGGWGNDTLDGATGNDTLDGGGGDDVLLGGAGDDLLRGREGGDTLIGGTGNDILYGKAGSDYWLDGDTGNNTYVFSVGDGVDLIIDYNRGSNSADIIQFTDVASTGLRRFERNGDDLVISYGATDQVTVKSYFVDSYHKIEHFVFSDGITWDSAYIEANVAVYGTSGNDSIAGSATRIFGLDGNDSLTGTGYNDFLDGGAGIDTLNGNAGNDLLQGGIGTDTITDTAGNNLFNGGADNDTLTGGAGNELFIGGTGNDSIMTAAGYDIVAFNKGDGQDTVVASTGKDNTLSLGGGITYADLSFAKSSNDLILITGTGEQITFKDWYASTTNHSIATLQMVIEGTTGYDAASTDPMQNKKIEQFNFDGLVSAFDQAKTANPALTSWSLSSSLLNFYLAGSDTSALGGDLAYQYGRYGSLSNISATPAQAILGASTFGSANQTLQPLASLQDASPRLS